MPVPAKRRARSQKRRRASHFALKPKNLITVGESKVPHAFKKALGAKKALRTKVRYLIYGQQTFSKNVSDASSF